MDINGRTVSTLGFGITESDIGTSNNGPVHATTKKGEIKLKALAAALVETTTCHGIPRIYSAAIWPRRIFWSTVFLTAVSLFLWQFSVLLENYYDYDVDVNLQIKFQTNAEFPAITICNINPFKFSKARENQGILELLGDKLMSRRRRSIERNRRSDSNTTYENWDTMTVDFESMDSDFLARLQVYDYVANLNYSKRMQLGHDINDILISCSWKGYPCSPSNFTQFYNYMYGNCYTFNSGESGTVLEASKPGPLYGLTLKLYVEQHEYMHAIGEAAGIRVLVHPPNEMPFPEDNGFSISPGQETNVGLRLLSIIREPDPYGDCKDSTEEMNVFTEFFGVKYSRQACEKNCYLDHVIDRCGCTDYRFNYFNMYNVCRHGDTDQATCVEQTEWDYFEGKLSPCSNYCTERCTDTTYRTTVTTSLWPNTVYKSEITAQVQGISSSMSSRVQSDSTFAESNLCKINIYYEEFNYEAITESPKYQLEDLLSDLGGQLGLWIGMSFISVFEFLEFCYDVFKWLLDKIFNKSRIRSTTIN